MPHQDSPSSSVPIAVFTAILLLCAAGSAYQVTSKLFYCGHTGAGDEIWYWTVAAALQSFAFLAAGWSPRMERLYRLSQWLLLPLLIYVLYQLSAQHARPILLAGIGVAAYALFAGALDRRSGPGAQGRAQDDAQPAWPRLILEGVLFVLILMLIQSALAFLVLYSRGVLLNDRNFGILFAASVAIAFVVVRWGVRVSGTRLQDAPPLCLLIMILLRAKLPDGAYDSLFYKATHPAMIADWRTALTGLPDHALMGTNLQEIMNAQWLILDKAYAPAFITTLAFLGLWVVAPAAARALSAFMPAETGRRSLGLMLNAAALLIVSLTESLTAAGTSYHEPMLMLLLSAGLLAGPAGWVFLAGAMAVKITALFFLPLFLLIRLAGTRRERLREWMEAPLENLRRRFGARSRERPGLAAAPALRAGARRKALPMLVLCGALAVLVFGEQLARNQLLSGRLLAPSEALAGLTDPQGRMMARIDHNPQFDEVSKRKSFDTLITTIIHIGTLNKWMHTEDMGFHALPSSRLPMAAVLLALLALLGLCRRETRPWALTALLFALLFVVFLKFFTQGRHMSAASFAAVLAVATAPAFLRRGEASRMVLTALTLGIGLCAVGDQLVGNFINVGWECTRRLSAPAVAQNAVSPPGTSAELDRKLADIVAQYRAKMPARRSVVPTVLCDEGSRRKPYMGAHYIYSVTTQHMLRRYLEADPARVQRLSRSTLAVCVKAWHLVGVKREFLNEFTFVDRIADTDIFVSNYLMDGALAAQMVPSGFPVPGAFRQFFAVRDFGADWKAGTLADDSPKDTVTRKGALEMRFDDQPMAALVAPNALTFERVTVMPGDRVHMEAALPFHQSDGLRVELRLTLPGKQPLIARASLSPRLREASEMNWQTLDLPIPEGYAGIAAFTVSIDSRGGNEIGDWIVFRKLQQQRRGQ
jgi:hypothetical protein